VKPQSVWPVSNPRSGPGISVIRRKSAAPSTAMVGDVKYMYSIYMGVVVRVERTVCTTRIILFFRCNSMFYHKKHKSIHKVPGYCLERSALSLILSVFIFFESFHVFIACL
jgi:hypothetical protein